ncbi:FAD-dependent oxidoreductase [Hamadaea tsunoensis]|uniref:FAD-dependent oxidoreductase n=1 Tax=Hamadaea tsunoensis TaxID=53368 RepID=UPI000405E806|nr:FAD-dependent oxidoreductase [Hamadaea tsunoensis]
MLEYAEVIVAGAGPVGLMLACELRLAGVDVVVVERRTDIDQTIKAGAINNPTIRALDRRGFRPRLEEARAVAQEQMAAFLRSQGAPATAPGTAPQPPARPRFAGHFGGIMLDAGALDPEDPDLAADSSIAGLGMIGQQALEAMLAERAGELGVDLRRGVEVTGFTETADRVVVQTTAGDIEAGWLVGCDGGRSRVRKLAGFEFPGTEPEITAYQAIARMTGTEGLRGGWNITDTGVYAFGPVPGRILVAEFGGAPADRDAAVTPSELEGAIRRVTGVEVTVEAIQTVTRFTDNARQVPAYRKGRVLLAGDAAHVHSPFGGQGLNLGFGDAVNLGWKLAATVRGWAPADLLDTYTAERHPIGAWVLDWTRAQIAVMRPDRHARAIRAVLGDLASTMDGATYLAKKIAGVWQGYDLPGDHPLTGRSAPDLAFADGTRLADHLHEGRALLIDLTGGSLGETAAGYEDRLKVLSSTVEGSDLRALLVRPDGYVAWASSSADADPAEPAKALALWLGLPTL